MSGLNAKLRALEVPKRLRSRPIDERGFLVPWFVAWVDGRPDHRCVDQSKMSTAIRARVCWLCGEPLGRFGTFVIGPMCLVTLNVSEPPSHLECARFAVQACPFLSQPRAERRGGLPEPHLSPAGYGFRRNPGVTVLATTRSWRPYRAPRLKSSGEGWLWEIQEPLTGLEWWAYGRAADRAEALESLESGAPNLERLARLQDQEEPGAGALEHFQARLSFARGLLPSDSAEPPALGADPPQGAA